MCIVQSLVGTGLRISSSIDLGCYHTHEQISIKIHLPLGFILTDISGCQIES